MKKRELAIGLALVGAVSALCLKLMAVVSRRIETMEEKSWPPRPEK